MATPKCPICGCTDFHGVTGNEAIVEQIKAACHKCGVLWILENGKVVKRAEDERFEEVVEWYPGKGLDDEERFCGV